MMGMLIGNLINIVLDPVMILGFGWDVAGAAIATVLGNVFAALYYIRHLLSKNASLSIHPKYYRAGGGIAAGVLAIGIPASLNSILMSLSNIVVNNIMFAYGDMAVAGAGRRHEGQYDRGHAPHRTGHGHPAGAWLLLRRRKPIRILLYKLYMPVLSPKLPNDSLLVSSLHIHRINPADIRLFSGVYRSFYDGERLYGGRLCPQQLCRLF